MNANNVIAVDFRRKERFEAHAPFARGGVIRLLTSGVYRVAASVTFALACWLASLALLFARWL